MEEGGDTNTVSPVRKKASSGYIQFANTHRQLVGAHPPRLPPPLYSPPPYPGTATCRIFLFAIRVACMFYYVMLYYII